MCDVPARLVHRLSLAFSDADIKLDFVLMTSAYSQYLQDSCGRHLALVARLIPYAPGLRHGSSVILKYARHVSSTFPFEILSLTAPYFKILEPPLGMTWAWFPAV